jgi:hypothetical protein
MFDPFLELLAFKQKHEDLLILELHNIRMEHVLRENLITLHDSLLEELYTKLYPGEDLHFILWVYPIISKCLVMGLLRRLLGLRF